MTATSFLPEGTDTESWRVMSARVAWLIWLNQTRYGKPHDEAVEQAAWALEAPEFRAYVRLVMRNLVRSGVAFVTDPAAALPVDSEGWRLASARLAWMLWLTKYRAENRKNLRLEAARWAEQAADCRAMTRAALKALSYEGIGIASDQQAAVAADGFRDLERGEPAFAGQVSGPPALETFRAFVEPRPMTLEAIVSDIYARRCEGRQDYALFDGGAHRAYHSLQMLALPGCAKVYAVEADPYMAETCRGILAEQAPDAGDRLVLIQKALQNDPAVRLIDWKSSPSHAGRSSIVSSQSDRPTIWEGNAEMRYRDDMQVVATTIDKIMQDEPRPVPFLKLDLEGADLLALMGARTVLQAKRPIVAFENSVHAPKVHGFTLDEMAAYFASVDYVPMNFVGEPIGPDNWFGFFEAWAAPREDVDWLREELAVTIAHYMA